MGFSVKDPIRGSITGNAGTATRATGDKNGLDITNYIKGLSINGKVITYTKGDDTTGTITTQDTVYTLPVAGTGIDGALGGIKVGSGLSIDAGTGVLSATGEGTIAENVEWSGVLNKPTKVSYWTNDANYITLANVMAGATASTAGKAGVVPAPGSGDQAKYLRGDGQWASISKSDVGLGNVDNTSDANKPISTATQTALDEKVSKAGDTMTGRLTISSGDLAVSSGYLRGDTSSSTNHVIKLGHANDNTLDFYEYGGIFRFYKSVSGTNTLLGTVNENGWVGSAQLSGTPTAPTAAAGTNTTQIATTAFVTSNYVQKAGDTMTGNLTIQKASPKLILKASDTSDVIISIGNSNYTRDAITASNAGVNGYNLVIDSGGRTIIGSGEGGASLHSTLGKNTDSEVLYLISDQQIYFDANGQTIGNRLGFQLNNSGNLVPTKADVAMNNTGSIGQASNNWANMYASNYNFGNNAATITYNSTDKCIEFNFA